MAQELVVWAKMRGRRGPNFLVVVVPDVNSPRLGSQLQADQSPFDRPDLLLQELYMCTGEMVRFADCVSRVLFDCFVAQCISVREGQKRGCPHSCSLLWMQELKTSKTLLLHHRLLVNSKLSMRVKGQWGLFGGQTMMYHYCDVSEGGCRTRGAAHSHCLIWIN